uniref:Uncharacterized protein n=1 Tax=Oryza brachyantha TaxID=4533 RepID=J3MA95_ORYBR
MPSPSEGHGLTVVAAAASSILRLPCRPRPILCALLHGRLPSKRKVPLFLLTTHRVKSALASGNIFPVLFGDLAMVGADSGGICNQQFACKELQSQEFLVYRHVIGLILPLPFNSGSV